MASRTRRWWTTIGGVDLRIDVPPAFPMPPAFWWWPLHRAARVASHEGAPDLLRLDEFAFLGTRRRRQPNLDLWIYVHERTRAELFVTDHGETFRLTASPSDPGKGRFTSCPPHVAAQYTGLPDLPLGTLPDHFVGVPLDQVDHNWAQLVSRPQVHPHDRQLALARRRLTQDCWGSGRLARWPFGPGGHRLGDDQPVDELGRCSDHRCERCFRDPGPSLSPEHLAERGRWLTEMTRQFAERGTADLPLPPDSALDTSLAARRRRAPTRRRPIPSSPYRPLPTPGYPLPPPSMN